MKKLQNESGRSMVEMLGVLAVIGVLSVGGIAGYKMAVERIKINAALSLIDRFMVSYEAEHAKPEGESPYDDTTATTYRDENKILNYFCENYLGSDYCGTVTDRLGKKFVQGGVTGPDGTDINFVVGRNHYRVAEDSIYLFFNAPGGKYTNLCHKILDPVAAHYGDQIIAYAIGSGDAYADVNKYCATYPNYVGFILPW